jgi:predicted ribosome-associated RNA-binding protein Tma20
MKKLLLVHFFLYFSLISNAQILNAYAKITTINGAKKKLTVTNVDQSAHTFTVGGQVIVMQMQDDVIGTYTTNFATFGDVGKLVV